MQRNTTFNRKTVEEHEEKMHDGTPVTWEAISAFFTCVVVILFVCLLGWLIFGSILGVPPTANYPTNNDCTIVY